MILLSYVKYAEENLTKVIKKWNLYYDRELVTKVLFHTLLKEVPSYDIDTEVKIKVYDGKIYRKSIYADLILTEIAPNKAKQNRFVFKFKSKGVNFLDLNVGSITKSWEVLEEKAKKVRMIPIEDLRQLKCSNLEKYDKDKSVQDILNNGREQVLNYVRNLDDKNDYHTSAFVVMSVGSRRVVWDKAC
ncbi:hypothetical protein F8M41_024424 [Gigaspora margarita]|uniref:Uncharacterized protein n=1 Tax=Gigaspora margarita TaxID=4874 RepID=A0A8H4B0L5_GIGMA|nr:hypothetical protein F8M41_024424 [Gigaspora margarita]